MKKNILLLVASASLLASCGNNNNNGAGDKPVEPEVQQIITKEAGAEQLQECANNYANRNAIGLELNGGLALETHATVAANSALNLPVDIHADINAGIKDLNANIALNGLVASGNPKGSAEIGAKVYADLSIPSMSMSMVDETPVMSVEQKDFHLGETALNASAYLEEGNFYIAMSDTVDDILAFVGNVAKGLTGEDLELPFFPHKFSLAMGEDFASGIETLPVMLGGGLVGVASMFAEEEYPEALQPFAEFIKFKKYTNMDYGVSFDYVLEDQNIGDLLANLNMDQSVGMLFNGVTIDANLHAFVTFNEHGIKNAGISATADLSSDEEAMMNVTGHAELNLGAKLIYDSEVQPKTLTADEKATYRPLSM